MDRLRTLSSWSDESARVQFVIANITNDSAKEFDMSKSAAAKRDAEDIAVTDEVSKGYSSEHRGPEQRHI